MKQNFDKEKRQTWEQVWSQMNQQVGKPVKTRVWSQVEGQVGRQVRNHLTRTNTSDSVNTSD